MKGNKQTVKGQKLSPQYVQEVLPKKKGVKVVNVRLVTKGAKSKAAAAAAASAKTPKRTKSTSAKNSTAAKAAAVKELPAKSAKKTAAAAKKAAAAVTEITARPSRSTKNSKAEPQKLQKVAKPTKSKAAAAAAAQPTKARAASAETRQQPVEQAAPQPEVPEALSLELLRPFREAARKNKQLQRERDRSRNRKSSFLAKPLKKGKKYIVDLRVHSPGSHHFFSTGGVDPAPALVRLAKVKGIDIVGLTDCYDASYVDAVKESAQKSGVTIIPGVELRCIVADCDEISILALFPESFSGADVYTVLDELQVPKWAYGRSDFRLAIPFAEVVRIIESHGGAIIPSRVDKTPFRHLAIPTMVEEFGFHAFDLIHPDSPEFFREHWPEGQFTFFSFSNANALGQIGSRTSDLRLGKTGFDGIKELVQRRV